MEEAEQVLKKICKFNKRDWPDGVKLVQPVSVAITFKTIIRELNTFLKQGNDDERDNSAQIWDLFRTRNMLKKTLIQYFLWFTIAMIYYALSLNSDSFVPGGNAYVNALIGGGIECLSYCLTIPVLLYFGRRWPLALQMFISGFFLLMVMVVPSGTWALVMASLGRMGIAAAFAVIYLYSVELFPTVLRTSGFGSASMVSR